MTRWPKISFVIPTLDAEKYLELCLASIVKQDYPKDSIEMIIIDGGSNDKTVDISLKYGCKILKNKKIIAEYGKAIGIKESKGDYFILLDSDNEIVETDWLKKMVGPILESKEIFGVESALSYDRQLSSINRYLARIRIADPLAGYLVDKPERIDRKDGYKILRFKRGNKIITGANGFLWNKKLVFEKVGWNEKFEEANFSNFILSETGFGYAIPYGASIRHYYCEDISSYIKKRKKIALKAKNRIKNNEKTWFEDLSKVRLFFISAYMISFFGPLFEAVYKSVRDRTLDWFWHPVVNFVTILVYFMNFILK